MGGHTGGWDWGGGGYAGYPDETESLRLAMAKDPYLHVMVGAGYYDMATPFANAEYNFRHLGFDQTYKDRVDFKYYESGHMAYLNQASASQAQAGHRGLHRVHQGGRPEVQLRPRSRGRTRTIRPAPADAAAQTLWTVDSTSMGRVTES